MAKKQQDYGNESITMLKGPDKVRKRPGVIFGSDGLDGCEHSVFEVISNSIDEARSGYGNKIVVTKYNDNTIEVEDFGRGVTTRLIGAIIMTHGDDSGLVLPPAIAPIQAVIVPIAQHKEGVLDKANELLESLKACGIRAKLDDSDNSPGWKFAEYEMKGVPVRIEIGPKDIENNQCVIVTRHNREKTIVSIENLSDIFCKAVSDKLQEVHDGMYQKALENRKKKTYSCTTIEEIISALEQNGDGFIKAMWCGDEACEDAVKEKTGVGSRCIPFEQENLSDKCICCGKPAKCMVYWGKAY